MVATGTNKKGEPRPPLSIRRGRPDAEGLLGASAGAGDGDGTTPRIWMRIAQTGDGTFTAPATLAKIVWSRPRCRHAAGQWKTCARAGARMNVPAETVSAVRNFLHAEAAAGRDRAPCATASRLLS